MPQLSKFLGTAAIALCFAGGAMADGAKPAANKPVASPAAAPKTDLKADTVVATVNGQTVTLGQMVSVRAGLPAQYQSLPDNVLFNGILDQLVQQTALSQIGEKQKNKKDDIALEVERRSYFAGAVLDQIANDAVTDDAVQKAYDAKYAKAEPGMEYHAAHIIVETEDEAKAVKADIDGGKDFAQEAKDKSQDGAAANGGDLGWFTLDKMVQPFSDAVKTMKPGDVAGPIQTEYGWHVIKLLEERPAKAPALDEVRDEISSDLSQQAVQDAVTKAVSDAKVVKSVDGIDPSVLKNEDILGK